MKWKTINIFISSTFNDMHSERDYIRKVLVPKLNETLANHRICVQTTDLRWGISTTDVDEAEREAKVLHVCLNAIRNSRPYFIALIGDRYGWIPSLDRIRKIIPTLGQDQRLILDKLTEEVSVTEMEILLGALGDQQMIEHSFFCFRKIESAAQLPQDIRHIFFDLPETKAQRKLTNLKQKIIETCQDNGQQQRILYYSAEWNNDKGKIGNLNQFGKDLYDKLLADIMRHAVDGSVEDKESYKEDEETIALENFMTGNAMNFIGREETLHSLLHYFHSHQSAKGVLSHTSRLLITGESGCGKSYLLSALYERLTNEAESRRMIVLAHAAGITRESTSTRSMLYRWCRQLLNVLNDNLPLEKEHSSSMFPSLILRVQGRGFFPVVIIDSLDSFKEFPDNLLRTFSIIPNTVPVICTTVPEFAKSIRTLNAGCEIMDIDSFSRKDAMALISHRLNTNVKELTQHQIRMILDKTVSNGHPAYESPLWLQMVLSILMELGSEDFQNIHRQHVEQEDRKIEIYLDEIIQRLPADPRALFATFISLTSGYFNTDLTHKVLALLAIAMDGIDENMMSEIIGSDWDTLEFTGLQYWMRDFIYRDVHNGKWKLTHNILKGTVRNLDPGLIDQMTGQFLDYVEKRVENGKEDLADFFYLLIEGKHYDRLAEHLASAEYGEISRNAEAICSISKVADRSSISQALSLFLDTRYSSFRSHSFIEYIIHLLTRQEKKMPSEEGLCFLMEISGMLPEKFSPDDIFGGDPELLTAYFSSLSLRLNVENELELIDQYNEDFNRLLEDYFKNKDRHGVTVLSDDLIHNIFFAWHMHILNFYYDHRDDGIYVSDLIKHLDSLFDELDWFFNNLDHFLRDNRDYLRLGESLHLFIPDYFNRYPLSLPIEKADDYMHRLHAMMLKTYRSDFNEHRLEIFAEKAIELIDAYIKNHQPDYFGHVVPFETTPLMQFLGHPGYEELHIEMEENARKEIEARLSAINFDTGNRSEAIVSQQHTVDEVLRVSCKTETAADEEIDEEIGIEETTASDNTDETSQPADEIIQLQREAIDDLMGAIDYSETDSTRNVELIGIYRELVSTLSQDLISTGNRDEALALLSSAGIIFCRPIIQIGGNYVIRPETAKNLKQLGSLYEKFGEENKAIELLESVVANIWHSYYLHFEGEAQRWLLNYMDDLYNTYAPVSDLLRFREKRFAIASISYISFLHLSRVDLWYLSEPYNDLFNVYRKTGNMEKCIRLLKFWEDICFDTYQNGRNKETAIERFEEIDDRLKLLQEEDSVRFEEIKKTGIRFPDGSAALLKCKELWHNGPSLERFCRDNNKEGFRYRNGEMAIRPKYSECRPFKERRAAVARPTSTLNRKWGFIDEHGKEIVKLQYASVGDFREGLAWVCISPTGNRLGAKGERFGYIDIDGNLVIPAIYDETSSFVNGKALVFSGNRDFYIDSSGKEVRCDGYAL